MARFDTAERKVMMKPTILSGLQADNHGIENTIEEMARDGWVLISQVDHGGLIGMAHTKLIFRKILPDRY